MENENIVQIDNEIFDEDEVQVGVEDSVPPAKRKSVGQKKIVGHSSGENFKKLKMSHKREEQVEDVEEKNRKRRKAFFVERGLLKECHWGNCKGKGRKVAVLLSRHIKESHVGYVRGEDMSDDDLSEEIVCQWEEMNEDGNMTACGKSVMKKHFFDLEYKHMKKAHKVGGVRGRRSGQKYDKGVEEDGSVADN